MRKKNILLAAAFTAIAIASGSIVSIYGMNKGSVEVKGAAQAKEITDTVQTENGKTAQAVQMTFSCGIPECTQTEAHQHGLCGIDGCTQTGEHSHSICGIAGCTETEAHLHNSCGVSGCMEMGSHTHNSCGIAGCTQTGAHRHGENGGGHHQSGHRGGHH